MALLVSSSGLVLVLVGAGAGAGAGRVDSLATLMALGTTLTYTAYILVSHHVTANLAPLPLSALVATGTTVTVGLVGVLTGSLDAGFETQGWIWLGLISLISTVAAVLLFFAGLQRVGPSTASILATFEPVLTVVLAFVILGESFTSLQFAGGSLVVLGVLVLQTSLPGPRPA
jgi:drug/metabolite transporter (DMT)-like permease